MKKVVASLTTLCFSILCFSTFVAAEDKQDEVDRLKNATEVIQQIMATPDKGIPEEVLDKAKCVAVVPHLLKGGFVFGAKHGRGVATCRTAHGWSAPSFFTVNGGSWGLQIGVEGVDLIMLVMNDKGMQELLNSKFQLGGEASAAAGPVGRHASADTDWKLNTEILTYSRSKGAFAGVTLEGAGIAQDQDAIQRMYGKEYTVRQILTGQVTPPASAHQFLAAVANAKNVASNK